MSPDEQARSAVLYQLAQAHDHFAELEQTYHLVGSEIPAEGARRFAARILRAWTAECDDPEPAGLPISWTEA